MMDFLFAILLVPFFPELGDPKEKHAMAMAELVQRLNTGQKQAVVAPEFIEQPSSLSVRVEDLPPITGRLFQWASIEGGDGLGQGDAIDLSAESLRLTGLIETAGQRVAILNDGEKDHVVGVGSYVLGAYKVTSFGPGRVVLSPIHARAGGKRLELNLMQANIPGDAQ
jgi:hypothetical protein